MLDGHLNGVGAIVEEDGVFILPVLLENGDGRMSVAVYSVRKQSWESWWNEVASRVEEDQLDPIWDEQSDLKSPTFMRALKSPMRKPATSAIPL